MTSPYSDEQSTRRLTTPEAEKLLGVKIPCLDRGFVYLVDYMGGDASIVQAARVSYGIGTKTVNEDRGLIRYLMRHAHTTPFEMVELKFHMKLPIFVARQLIRHRTACLAGDVELAFDLPGAGKRGRRQRHNVAIADLHRLWHEGTRHPIRKKKPTHVDEIEADRVYTIPELARAVGRRAENLRALVGSGRLKARRVESTNPRAPRIFVRGSDWQAYASVSYEARVPMRDRLAAMQLRMCDEATGEIGHTSVVDVWASGIKPVFRVTLENGYSIKMTKDHRCLTEAGWSTLERAVGLSVSDAGKVSWRRNAPAFAVNGVRPHQSPEWLASRRHEGLSVSEIAAAAGVSYHTIRKGLSRFGLQFTPGEKAQLSGRAQQGTKREGGWRRTLNPEALERVRAARSGERSNFWKGGVTPERANIGRWTREHAARVHERNGYRCVVCGGDDRLHAHHVDPVWHNSERARDIDNLTSLCSGCHTRIHSANLELAFLESHESGEALERFRTELARLPRPVFKRAAPVRKLVRTYSKVATIEFAGHEMTYDLEVAGPYHNFVANGFVVHNSVNEYSGRYSIMPDEFYVPEPQHVNLQSRTNRQGGGERVDDALAAEVVELIEGEQRTVREGYEQMLAWDIRRELARVNLGVAQYTEWYWKCDLHNIFHFLRLRLDDHAQYEIRVYAQAMATIVKAVAPVAYEAFEDYVREADRFSGLELETLKRLFGAREGGWPADEEIVEALPEVWRQRGADGALKRHRERDEFLAKLARLREFERTSHG
jgi:thymidylate synthase ThyX